MKSSLNFLAEYVYDSVIYDIQIPNE